MHNSAPSPATLIAQPGDIFYLMNWERIPQAEFQPPKYNVTVQQAELPFNIKAAKDTSPHQLSKQLEIAAVSCGVVFAFGLQDIGADFLKKDRNANLDKLFQVLKKDKKSIPILDPLQGNVTEGQFLQKDPHKPAVKCQTAYMEILRQVANQATHRLMIEDFSTIGLFMRVGHEKTTAIYGSNVYALSQDAYMLHENFPCLNSQQGKDLLNEWKLAPHYLPRPSQLP